MMRSLASLLPLAAALVSSACGADHSPPIVPPPPPQLAPPSSASASGDDAPDDAADAGAAKPSLADLEVTTLHAITDAVAVRDAKRIGQLYASDAVVTVYGIRTLVGRDDIVAEYQRWLDGMSDLKFQIGRVLQNADVAVAEWAFTGTHSGDFLGAKATQSPVGASGASVLSFDAEGHITKEHRFFDAGTITKQDDKHAKSGTFRAPPPLPVGVDPHPAKSPADAEAALSVVRSLYAALDADKAGDAIALLSDDVAIDDAAEPHAVKGKKDARALFDTYEAKLPGGASTATTLFAADDLVAAEREVKATVKKKPVTAHFLALFQIKGGAITRVWAWSNGGEVAAELEAPKKK